MTGKNNGVWGGGGCLIFFKVAVGKELSITNMYKVLKLKIWKVLRCPEFLLVQSSFAYQTEVRISFVPSNLRLRAGTAFNIRLDSRMEFLR